MSDRGGKAEVSKGDEARLLAIVAALAEELHPGRVNAPVTLDFRLDQELGFDSLSGIELLMRIEQAFGVTLPEQLLASAETPRELLRAVRAAGRARASPAPGAAVELPEVAPASAVEGVPRRAQTLVEMLQWHLERHPERIHVHLYESDDRPSPISYEELYRGASALAAGLRARGLQPGQTVAIMLPTSRDYLFSFFGILLAGGVPVPIYPPARPSQLEDHLRRHARILDNAGVRLLITVEEARLVARLLKAQVGTLSEVVIPAGLRQDASTFTPVPVEADDIAFLQYTSGSTGQPKGVILTHGNLLANIRAMGEATAAGSQDVFVSWLPLYHDMGLIGAWLGSLYYAMTLVLMSPLAFLARPGRWLWRIHRHRGTLSAAPNFAYELCLSKVSDAELKGLDLSSWRLAFNGAEPVSPATVRRFTERFAAHGFASTTMAPVYGLAEAAVGLAFPPLGREPPIDRVRREPLLSRGEAQPAGPQEPDVLEFVACGRPLAGYQLRVVDPAGRELPDRREGRIEFRGPSATSGYYRNAEATRRLFHDGWLDTGDLGYIAGGDIHLTSRAKDLIIRGGRNLYPYEVEEAVGDLPGIRKGCVALFGARDPGGGTERLVLVAETRETDPQVKEKLRALALKRATEILGMPPDEVFIAAPHTVLKTSSGKIRRSAMRELYEQGKLERAAPSVARQLARLALASIGPRWRQLRRQALDLAWAGWAHLLFWLLAPAVWLLVVLLPGEKLRWRVVRWGARLLLRGAGVPLKVSGLERLPRNRAAVLVANHASYLDGVVLVAALPLEMVFVAKSELRQQLIPRLFLERFGILFVERFRREKGLAEVKKAETLLRGGRSLLFFPEGTLGRAPGLLPFRMGAFVTAAETGAPVVPIVIRGTRSLLRGTSWFPHRAALRVEVLEPLPPEQGGWEVALKLRERARQKILERLGEPDLAVLTPADADRTS